MHMVHFHKLIPGGNPTLILTGPLPHGISLPLLCATLIHPMHIGAEQAGQLLFPHETHTTLPTLRMMGGEFCVNATRAAAVVLAKENLLRPLCAGVLHGSIVVSSMPDPVSILVAGNQELLDRVIQHALEENALPLPPVETEKRLAHASTFHAAAQLVLRQQDIALSYLESGAVLVQLPGISHVLLNASIHPFPLNAPTETKAWRKKAGIENDAASGVVWYHKTAAGIHIEPFVFVRETATEHHETACGSASLALALQQAWELLQPGKTNDSFAPYSLTVVQPSGEHLSVSLAHDKKRENGATGIKAFISGPVHFVAEGTAPV